MRTALIAVVPVYVYSASIRPAIGDTSLTTARDWRHQWRWQIDERRCGSIDRFGGE
jgi:hypothetical protein